MIRVFTTFVLGVVGWVALSMGVWSVGRLSAAINSSQDKREKYELLCWLLLLFLCGVYIVGFCIYAGIERMLYG